jgi:hypothetical protein
MAFDKPITWMSATRLGLGFAGEYSLLSLIEDSPESLKIATMVCSFGVLAALEGREWLNSKRPHLFRISIVFFSAIYSIFIFYAIAHSWHQSVISAKLDDLYNRGTEFQRDRFFNRLTDADFPSWSNEASNWLSETGDYLKTQIGGITYSKFMNTVGSIQVGYSQIPSAYVLPLNNIVPKLKNLESLIEQRK